jgi:hypothetical protein
MVICCACTILSGVWESLVGYHFQVYLPWEHFVPGSLLRGLHDENVAIGSAVTAMLVFLSYAIVLNTVVPISLYVRSVLKNPAKLCIQLSTDLFPVIDLLRRLIDIV